MIYQVPGELEYLAVYEKPLFPLYAIKNILFKYGADYTYNYTDTELQFIIVLENDNKYVIEYANYELTGFMLYNGKRITEEVNIKATLKKYNNIFIKRDNLECLFQSMEATVDEGYGNAMR